MRIEAAVLRYAAARTRRVQPGRQRASEPEAVNATVNSDHRCARALVDHGTELLPTVFVFAPRQDAGEIVLCFTARRVELARAIATDAEQPKRTEIILHELDQGRRQPWRQGCSGCLC